MVPKLVILDCDGVLVASEELSNSVLADTLTRHGHKFSADELIARFRGVNLTKILETLEQETGKEFPVPFESDVRQRMSSAFKEQLQPVDGAQRLVECLQVPFCVASSGPRKKIEENLKTTNLYKHFADRVFSGYEIGSWKPDPGLFLAAASHFGVAPKDCVVIEDSFVGVSAGIAANMTVLALNATAGEKRLAAAHKVFASLHDIHEYLVSQNLAHE